MYGTGNVKQLIIRYSNNCMDWRSVDILTRWKFKGIDLNIPPYVTSLIVHTCLELTSIELDSSTVDDAVVIAITQHCPKLEKLVLKSKKITWTSLLALSEQSLHLKELDICSIPSIPTADIAWRCSHALSCVCKIVFDSLHQNGQDASILLPYMTGLTSVYLAKDSHIYLPQLTQYCHKLTTIEVYDKNCSVEDILPLCRANSQLQSNCFFLTAITDIALIELIHACPLLRSLCLPYATNITDTDMLTLSEKCPQLQELEVFRSHNVTEAAVLQLLQRCRKLTSMAVSTSSLSEDTWTQLDSNTQKRVIRSE